jgi:hypothetical protein
MNVFYVDKNPTIAAQCLVNSHCVKMILESAQLLSTAHRVLDGKLTVEKKVVNGSLPIRHRNVKRWVLDDDRESALYSATHVNHPSAIWCRQSTANYVWLYDHFIALLDEYTYRYGKKHKCETMASVLRDVPNNISPANFTQPPPAMDDSYIISEDSVVNYRNYYKHGKSHLHKWTNREAPLWMTE